MGVIVCIDVWSQVTIRVVLKKTAWGTLGAG